MGVVADLFVAGNAPHQVHLPVSRLARLAAIALEIFEDLQTRVVDGVGVVVRAGAGDEGLAPHPVKALHLIGTGLDHVDGPFVERFRGAGVVHLGDDVLGAVGGIDDHEVALGDGTQ